MAESNSEEDVKDFYFKQMCKLRVFDSPKELIKNAVNYLCISNKNGKIYVVAAENGEVKQIDISVIEKITAEADKDLSSIDQPTRDIAE
eukprot:gene15721-17306_t